MNLSLALDSLFEEVHYNDFYRDIFPVKSFENKGEYIDGKYNGILVAISNSDKKIRRYTVTDDLDIIDHVVNTDDFCIMSPISYAGKSRKSENARYLYALAIDLDGVETKENWDFFLKQILEGEKYLAFVWGLPKPTYVVSSGTGLHLYYVFKKPIPLFKNIVKELEKLRTRITWQAWTQGASVLHDNIQFESLFQGFRMVGSITKKGNRVKAYKVGEKVTIDYLNKYVPTDYRAEIKNYNSKISLKEAAQKYPEWYQKRVVEKQPKNTWKCKKDLYNWWIRTFVEKVKQGHRYWCVMTLATYAKKCGVDYETLYKDCIDLLPILNSKGDEFTEEDILHALEAYNDSYITYPIHTIVARTDIQIEKNKRNYRKQAEHIKLMNFVRDEINQNTTWNKIGNGRKSKEEIVKKWREENPMKRKIDCIKELKLSKPTVYKYWK